MTSEGLGEMFEGDSADMCARKFRLVSMGGRAEGLACVDPGARIPIVLAEIFIKHMEQNLCFTLHHCDSFYPILGSKFTSNLLCYNQKVKN